ncbi:MAG: 4-hydroxy-tetrahydrodipicolinate reductase [Acidobacteriaceae bacterium]
MRILVLGSGKTGKLVADIAAERSHTVRVLGSRENPNASALTPAFLKDFDAAIDFTTPEAVVANLRACLPLGLRMVIGTTGWYDHLPELRTLAAHHKTALLYGTNFSIGMQMMLKLAKEMACTLKDAGYTFTIEETHHVSKLDAPSGTALTLRDAVLCKIDGHPASQNNLVPITSHRTGDVEGVHSLIATGPCDRLLLTHESKSRRPFAEGAVRAAEWLSTQTGVHDFHEVFEKL